MISRCRDDAKLDLKPTMRDDDRCKALSYYQFNEKPKTKGKEKTFTFLTATSSEADTQWGLSYPDLISLSILTIGD